MSDPENSAVTPPPSLPDIPPFNQTRDEALPIRTGRWFVVCAGLLWSISGILIKSPTIKAIPADDSGMILAAYRTLFAAVGLMPFVNWKKARFTPKLVPSAILFAVMNVLFINGFTRTSAGAASFLQYTSTVWVFLFGWLLLNERIHRGNLFALACAVCGILWIVLSEREGQRAVGNFLALGSGAAYAGVVLTLRWLCDEDATWVTVVNHAVSGLVVLPIALARDVSLTGTQWAIIAFLGVFQMGLPYMLATRGVALIEVQEAALIMLLEPILIPFWAWLFWREHIGWPTIIGGTFIVGGLAVRYLVWPDRPGADVMEALEIRASSLDAK